MRFVSTGGQAPAASLGRALLEGPAPDGGLYVPEHLEPLTAEQLALLRLMPLTGISSILGSRLFGSEVPEEDLASLLEDALDFPIPLVPIEPGIFCLELFHGPTLAFKDIAARVMARLMSRFADAGGPDTTVIVATSGDTGSAVAEAFSGVARFRVCVLYPRGLVTEAQRRLFTTLHGNVTAVAVAGTFDDCQRMARAAFADRGLRRRRPLASANSINVGRLLPQVFYYFHAWAQLPPAPAGQADGPLIFSTPSGNFGNLTAGLIAKRIGLPVSRFVAATNVNDVVPAYLASGEYLARASVATISNAMDVGDPSNFARIRHLYSDRLDPLSDLRRDLAGHSFDDRTTRTAMREVYEDRGYLLDPHTAVGYLGLKDELEARGGGTGVVLGTAHPAKFADVIRDAVGVAPPVPPALERCANLPERIIEIPAEDAALREVLLG
ncbi:MAG: threonine synthase [Acidobacteria bacterium]|nr:threonine synthase [Acidobacteriota bacterium]